MFDTQLKKLERYPTVAKGTACSIWQKSPNIGGCCSPCLFTMTAWVNVLQRMDKLSDLKAALTATIDPGQLSSTYTFNIRAATVTGVAFSTLAYRFQNGLCKTCSDLKSWCYLMGAIPGDILKDIDNLPPFTSFLNERLDGEAEVVNEDKE